MFLPRHSAFSKQGKHSVEFCSNEYKRAGQSSHFLTLSSDIISPSKQNQKFTSKV